MPKEVEANRDCVKCEQGNFSEAGGALWMIPVLKNMSQLQPQKWPIDPKADRQGTENV